MMTSEKNRKQTLLAFTLVSLSASLMTLSFTAFAVSSPYKILTPALKKFSAAQSLKNWGLTNESAKSHISAPMAWTIEEGKKSVIVAVVDTGVDSNHPDLKQNIWQDPASKEKTYGWNFVKNAANPEDDHGHGTHIAGIIGAITNPKAGVSGVTHNVSIMGVKYYSNSSSGAVNLDNTVKALEYAIAKGAKIINYSGGGPEFSEKEYLAIKKAEAAGVLVVAAAGNFGQNIDQVEHYYYPAAYNTSNVISVASTDMKNNLSPFSNYGKRKVDVAAPGEKILSTLPGGRHGELTGTSQATAFVSGVAALLLSQNPKLTPQELKSVIVASVDKFPQLEKKIATGGRINAYSALLALRAKGQNEKLIAHKPTPLANLLRLQ